VQGRDASKYLANSISRISTRVAAVANLQKKRRKVLPELAEEKGLAMRDYTILRVLTKLINTYLFCLVYAFIHDIIATSSPYSKKVSCLECNSIAQSLHTLKVDSVVFLDIC